MLIRLTLISWLHSYSTMISMGSIMIVHQSKWRYFSIYIFALETDQVQSSRTKTIPIYTCGIE
jgi:hypothetical protein